MKSKDSYKFDSFYTKYFLSCVAATIAESGNLSSIAEIFTSVVLCASFCSSSLTVVNIFSF